MLRLATRSAAAAATAGFTRRLMTAEATPAASIHAFKAAKLDGTELALDSLAGKPAIVVNVASQ